MATRTRRQLLDHTASLLSRKWTLRIVVALSTGVKRRCELSRILPDATQKVLTETLREMERTGILERSIYPTIPPHVEYRLTNIGLGLMRLSNEFDLCSICTVTTYIKLGGLTTDRTRGYLSTSSNTSIFLTEKSKSHQNLFW